MPRYVVERVERGAEQRAASRCNGSRVHLYGMAYKADVGDYRESPAIDIVRLLEERGAVVSYTDPHVPVVDDHGVSMTGLGEADGACRRDRLRRHRDEPSRVRLRRARARRRRSSSTRATR